MWSVTDPAGLTTTYDYDDGGRTTTVTRPGGAMEISERYLDGRVKSITGTGTVARYYAYGVNPDGTRWTRVYTGAPDSPRWEETTTDALGRTVRVERPAFGGGTEASERFYDDAGRLVRTTEPGRVDTLHEYDEVGNLVRTGLDVDGSGTLDPTSADRIEENDTFYAYLDGAWWRQTEKGVYPFDGAGTPVTVSTRRTRLTGLGGGLVSETVSVDVHGNETVTQVFVDRTAGTRTRIASFPDAAKEAVETFVNGLLVSSRSKTGVEKTYAYDGLGRRIRETDPRTDATLTTYDAQGRVASVTDPAGSTVTYGYGPATGRLVEETNALG